MSHSHLPKIHIATLWTNNIDTFLLKIKLALTLGGTNQHTCLLHVFIIVNVVCSSALFCCSSGQLLGISRAPLVSPFHFIRVYLMTSAQGGLGSHFVGNPSPTTP